MTSKSDNPADPFKKALAEATRALAGNEEMEVTYSADPPGTTNTGMRLPQVSRRMTRSEVMLARGTADAYALRERFHNTDINTKYTPRGEVARQIFDALETARCEAIGARAMPGVADNLDARLEHQAEKAGWDSYASTSDAPMHEAAALMLRKAVTGRELPKSAEKIVDLIRRRSHLDLRVDQARGADDLLDDVPGSALLEVARGR